MPNKRYKAEQIVTLLRQIEVGIANGKPTPQACKGAEITIQTYYRWWKEYGGHGVHGIAKGHARSEVEREGNSRELSLVVHRESSIHVLVVGKRTQWNLGTVR